MMAILYGQERKTVFVHRNSIYRDLCAPWQWHFNFRCERYLVPWRDDSFFKWLRFIFLKDFPSTYLLQKKVEIDTLSNISISKSECALSVKPSRLNAILAVDLRLVAQLCRSIPQSKMIHSPHPHSARGCDCSMIRWRRQSKVKKVQLLPYISCIYIRSLHPYPCMDAIPKIWVSVSLSTDAMRIIDRSETYSAMPLLRKVEKENWLRTQMKWGKGSGAILISRSP